MRTGDATLAITDFVGVQGTLSGCEVVWEFTAGMLDCYTVYVTSGVFNGGTQFGNPVRTINGWTANRFVNVSEDTCGTGANFSAGLHVDWLL